MIKIGDGNYLKIGEWEQDNKMSLYALNGFSFRTGGSTIGSFRICDWKDFIFDWTGTGTGSGTPTMYPSSDGWLQLGKPDKKIGKLYMWSAGSIIYGTTSDERIKENITPFQSPIEKIKQISGYHYNFKRDFFPNDVSEEAISNLTKVQIGFLAQEVEKVFPELIIYPETAEDMLSINYNGMIPVLLEAIKEQQSQIDNLQALIYEREYDLLFLMDQIDACCQNGHDYSHPKGQEKNNEQKDIDNENPKKNSLNNENNTPNLETARLFQNVPNPFSTDTKIEFEIPENTISARLLIHDMQGAEIKSYNIIQKGRSAIIVSGFELTAGMYLYTLLIDNKIIDTKRMILTK